jgi:hypothetical protein
MARGLIDELHGQGIPVAKDKIAGYLQKPSSGTELTKKHGAVVHLLH